MKFHITPHSIRDTFPEQRVYSATSHQRAAYNFGSAWVYRLNEANSSGSDALVWVISSDGIAECYRIRVDGIWGNFMLTVEGYEHYASLPAPDMPAAFL